MGDQMQIRDLLTDYPLRTYRKGEIILFQGEAPRVAYVLQKGVVKAYNISSSGDEKPIGFYGENSVFPAAWVLGRAPSAIYYYEAFTDVAVYCVPAQEYIELLKSKPEVLYAELENYVADEVGKSMRLNALQHSRASDKLIYTLHYLALNHGKELGQGVVELELLLTHQDFANLTGLTRETTATELNKLKKAGVINYGKHTAYKINTAKLRTALNDQFIADLQMTA
ncbi:MAG TPA: Crp/Fnr family transcriptional regulator [Candidatus Microsaccharimonas sp.]|nr:Crp/Fnr family transcriptional regulator [Candidatus Microsaccharimonas sp.]